MPLIQKKLDYQIIWLPPPVCSYKDKPVAGVKRKRCDTSGNDL